MGNTCSCLNNLINNNQCDLSSKAALEQNDENKIGDPAIKNIYESFKENYNFKEDSVKQLKGTFNNNNYNNNSNRNTNLDTSQVSNINININNINKIINNFDNNLSKRDQIKSVNNSNINNNDIIEQKRISNMNIITKNVKGYIFRKKYKKFLKEELIKLGNDLYNKYIQLIKNDKVTKILESKDPNIINYLQTSWSEFYDQDPTKEIMTKISLVKKYPKKSILFKYKTITFHSTNINECITSAKSCYLGEINLYNGQKCGFGKTIYSNGSIEEGTYYENEFIGWNKLVDNQGIIYVGLFNKLGLNGKGLRYNQEINHIYKGDFMNGLRHGKGKDYRNKMKYEGDFRKDKKCGKGKILFESGDTYEGEFNDNKFNGYGHYIWAKNKNEYKGNYLNGKFHGEGFYKWGENEYYNGEYVNGIKEGEGELSFKDGKKFFVNFTNGKPNGVGIFQDQDGNRCEVEFINGKINKNYKKN